MVTYESMRRPSTSPITPRVVIRPGLGTPSNRSRRAVAACSHTPLSRHWSPQLKPFGQTWRSGFDLGNGTFCRLLGRPSSTVLPVAVSMLATIIESVRTPVRFAPASDPSSSTLTRGTPTHGSLPACGVAAPLTGISAPSSPAPVNTELTRSRWISAYRTPTLLGAATTVQSAATSETPSTRWASDGRTGRTVQAVTTIVAHHRSAIATSAAMLISRVRGCTATRSARPVASPQSARAPAASTAATVSPRSRPPRRRRPAAIRPAPGTSARAVTAANRPNPSPRALACRAWRCAPRRRRRAACRAGSCGWCMHAPGSALLLSVTIAPPVREPRSHTGDHAWAELVQIRCSATSSESARGRFGGCLGDR
jgi:hypothetical protein